MVGLWMLLGLGACQKEATPVREIRVDAVLPLTGNLALAGQAFAKGFAELGNQATDSTKITVTLLDNASQADSTRALLATGRSAYLVAGLGYATIELEPRQEGFALWVGQEPQAPAGWTPLSATIQAQSQMLLAWCKAAPRPLAIVFGATGQWAPLVQEHLALALDSVHLIPHDGGETQWNREATRLLVVKPASVVLWHGLEQARSLLARPDLDSVWRQAKVLGPVGAGASQSWGPLWEPSATPNPAELAFWQEAGRQAAVRMRKAIANPKQPPEPMPNWIADSSRPAQVGKP